jgi:hypothetical protein
LEPSALSLNPVVKLRIRELAVGEFPETPFTGNCAVSERAVTKMQSDKQRFCT